MKLKEAKEAYYVFTGILSDRVRSLCYAGIAIIWIFRIGESNIPNDLLWPLILLVFSLLFDLIQYIYASIAWGLFYRGKEKKDYKDDDETKARYWINWPSLIFLILKVTIVIIGYAIMANALMKKI